jgi:uncharacterized protein DUF3606
MSDDFRMRGPEDRSRINVSEPWELKYWSKTLGVTPERLKEVIRQVGPRTEDVEQYLSSTAETAVRE